MPSTQPARTAARPLRISGTGVAGLLIAAAAIIAVAGDRAPASSPLTTSPTPEVAPRHDAPRSASGGALGEADGAVPAGTTAFDDDVPAVGNLDPGLLAALRRAATDAARDGVGLVVNSGWRSPAYQERLQREAVATYGSAAQAARWVAAPNTSAHVSGDAVDVGPPAAATWLSQRGAAYGLCRVYGNEPWHYELRPEAVDHGCPATYADPTHDPRMQP